MTNSTSFQYGSKNCHLPKSLVNNEEFMKEVVSANVWNNKLKKSDKVNLLKYLPTFPHNDTHEKKETLKKLFLGKPINFENQIKKFVRCAKEGEFNPSIKSQKVLDLLLSERKTKCALLKRRINDLKRIIDTKRKMGIETTAEEILCLEEHSYILTCDDPLDSVVNRRFNIIMERITTDGDVAKKRELYTEYSECVVAGDRAFQSLSLEDVVNRCQNEGEPGHEEALQLGPGAGPMTRKRRLLQNGLEAGLNKYARLGLDRDSSDSQSDSSDNNAKSVNDDQSNDSVSSGTDSVISSSQRRIRNNRHERREFRCPQDDFPDFFALLQRLFLGAHQQKLTTGQVEERIRHWQIVNQRQIGDEYNRWACGASDWVCLAVPGLEFLSQGAGVVEHRPRTQLWRWRAPQTCLALHQLFQGWRQERAAPSNGHLAPPPPPSSPSELIPPALYPTTWQMRPATTDERLLFQAQERRRFSRPHRAYTYNVHGYNCVVSPIRGCLPGRDYSGVRARGHPLLVPDRPPHVTIVEIVRDAVARLPNGQGSRADIVTMAMDSAYWLLGGSHVGGSTQERSIGQCISSALDRLQGEGCDPSVKYNARLKLWFYRHRDKSVREVEEMHLRSCQEEMRRSRALTTVTRVPVATLQPPMYAHMAAAPAPPAPRPSYQQFSRAVTTARDNSALAAHRPHHALFGPAAASASSSSAATREYFAQHPPHFYY